MKKKSKFKKIRIFARVSTHKHTHCKYYTILATFFFLCLFDS